MVEPFFESRALWNPSTPDPEYKLLPYNGSPMALPWCYDGFTLLLHSSVATPAEVNNTILQAPLQAVKVYLRLGEHKKVPHLLILCLSFSACAPPPLSSRLSRIHMPRSPASDDGAGFSWLVDCP